MKQKIKFSGIIYIFISPENKVYIGQTIQEKIRMCTHKRESSVKSPKKPFYRAIKKYGFDNFKYSILRTIIAASKEELKGKLNKAEKFYIVKYNSFKSGYNLTEGGDSKLITRHSEETKSKITNSMKGRPLTEAHRIKLRKKKVISDEEKIIRRNRINEIRKRPDFNKKLSAARKGKKLSLKTREKMSSSKLSKRCLSLKTIYQYDKTTNKLINTWNNVMVVSETLDIKPGGIYNCLKGIAKSAHGFIWSYNKNILCQKQKQPIPFQKV